MTERRFSTSVYRLKTFMEFSCGIERRAIIFHKSMNSARPHCPLSIASPDRQISLFRLQAPRYANFRHGRESFVSKFSKYLEFLFFLRNQNQASTSRHKSILMRQHFDNVILRPLQNTLLAQVGETRAGHISLYWSVKKSDTTLAVLERTKSKPLQNE